MTQKNTCVNIFSDITDTHTPFEYFGVHSLGEWYVFRLRAAEADEIFLVGDFNFWGDSDKMTRITDDGVWEVKIDKSRVLGDAKYKYKIVQNENAFMISDPCAFWNERSSENASIVFDVDGYSWRDRGWLKYRERSILKAILPINIYEIDLRHWKERNNFSYKNIASDLAPYVKQMGFTHVCIDFFYENSRSMCVPDCYLGTPKEFMSFVDSMHEAGIGVLLNIDGFLRVVSATNDADLFGSCVLFWHKKYHIDGFLYDKMEEYVKKSFCLAETKDTDRKGVYISTRYDYFFVDKKEVLGNEAFSLIKQFFSENINEYYDRNSFNRLIYAHRAISGVNVLFMGEEVYQPNDFDHCSYVQWDLLENEKNSNYQNFISDMNNFVIMNPDICNALDVKGNIMLDRSKGILADVCKNEKYLLLTNFSTNEYGSFEFKLNNQGLYKEIFNSDDKSYGGYSDLNYKEICTDALTNTFTVKLLPMSIVIFRSIKN